MFVWLDVICKLWLITLSLGFILFNYLFIFFAVCCFSCCSSCVRGTVPYGCYYRDVIIFVFLSTFVIGADVFLVLLLLVLLLLLFKLQFFCCCCFYRCRCCFAAAVSALAVVALAAAPFVWVSVGSKHVVHFSDNSTWHACPSCLLFFPLFLFPLLCCRPWNISVTASIFVSEASVGEW